MASLSKWEREAIAERTSFALAHKRRTGDVYGPVPFGFKRKGDKLVREDEQYATLRRIRVMRAGGQSLRRIVDWLNENGVKTPRGSPKWFVNTLHQVLTSEAAQELEVA